MTIKIFGVPLSPYVRKVKMALNYKGLDYELIPTTTVEAIDEMERYNPRSEVPTMIIDDVVITDSSIALEHIEEQHPEPPLLPKDAAGRAKARRLEDLGDRLGDAILFAVARVHMGGEGHLADKIMPAAKAELLDLYEFLDGQLGDQEFLCGDSLTIADLGLIPSISAAGFFQMGPGEEFPRVQAWIERCMAQPAVAKDFGEVMEAAGAGLPAPALPPGHPHAGANYRAERAEFFLRNGMADHLAKGIEEGTIRVGLPLNAKKVS